MATNLQDEPFHDGIEEVFHRSTLDWLNQEDLVAIYNRHHAIPLPLSLVRLGPEPLEEGIYLYARRRFRDLFEWDDVGEVRRKHCRTGRTPVGGEVTHTEATITMPEGDLFTRRNYHRGLNPFCLVHYLFRPAPVEDGGGDEAEDGGGDEAEDGGGDEAEDGGAAEAEDGGGDEAEDGGAAEAEDGSEQDSTESEDDLGGDPDYDPNLDEQLDASIHSIGYLLEALTRGQVTKGKSYDVALLIDRFINSCDAGQIRLANEKFLKLKDPVQGVAPLLSAVHKVQVSAKSLTASPPDCLQLCLQANWFKASLSQKYLTLSLQDIANMVQLANAKEAETHVLQMIQDGQVHALINQKDGMVRFLEDPEQHKTSEMIEVMDSVIQRTIGLSKNLLTMDESLSCDPLYLGKPYYDVGNRYSDGKISELKAAVVAHSSDFEEIQDGQVHALINQKDGMVRFMEDPEQHKTSEMIEVMDSVIQRTIGLSKNILAMDESLSCDPLYLGKVGRERQKYDFGDDFDTVPQKFSM